MSASRTNEVWLKDLASPGPAREAALADLREIIITGLPYALSRWLSQADPQFASLAEEVAQETLMRILDNLGQFEGRSQFTTWVHKIGVRIALTELRRKRWRDVSLDRLLGSESGEAGLQLLADPAPDPEISATQADMLAIVGRIMMEALTEKQRMALIATRVEGMPIEEVARRMGTNRNALYKLLHDARLRLKQRLAREGLTPEDVLAVFEST